MANGRHARGAEHPTAQLDPRAPAELSVNAPEMPSATGRRRRVSEAPAAPVPAEMPRQTAQETDGSVATGPGRRRRPQPEALADPILPAPTGRRRRAPEAAPAQLAAPQPPPGTGRRRRAPEALSPGFLTEPAPRFDAAPRAEAATPAPAVLPTPIVEPTPAPVVEVVTEPVVEVAEPPTASVIELAPRSHRRAPAKAPAKKAAAKPSGSRAAARTSGGHATARTSGGHAGERRKVVALPSGTPSGTALIAGAAAVAVAAAGAIGAANSGTDLAPTAASMSGASALGLSEGGALVDSPSVDREQARASRERARDALADRVAAAAALQKKQEAAARALAAAKARAQQLALIAKNYSLPVSGYHLTAGFGAGGYRWSNGHTGLDFACAYGTPIRAVAAGTVIFAGYDGSYGWKTIIRHADGTESWYAHQSQILVRRGQVVAGQMIGRVGMTGNTSGPHLHLEIRVNDNPINPLTWLRAHGLRP